MTPPMRTKPKANGKGAAKKQQAPNRQLSNFNVCDIHVSRSATGAMKVDPVRAIAAVGWLVRWHVTDFKRIWIGAGLSANVHMLKETAEPGSPAYGIAVRRSTSGTEKYPIGRDLASGEVRPLAIVNYTLIITDDRNLVSDRGII